MITRCRLEPKRNFNENHQERMVHANQVWFVCQRAEKQLLADRAEASRSGWTALSHGESSSSSFSLCIAHLRPSWHHPFPASYVSLLARLLPSRPPLRHRPPPSCCPRSRRCHRCLTGPPRHRSLPPPLTASTAVADESPQQP
jgi:hypothetical protein